MLRLSTDDGHTWPQTLPICAGSWAYSTVQRLPDGRIGVLYEAVVEFTASAGGVDQRTTHRFDTETGAVHVR